MTLGNRWTLFIDLLQFVSVKYSIPLFFATQGFDTFRNREISSGAGAIREQLIDLDLRIIMDFSLVEWKELGEDVRKRNCI
ncbi:DNA-directed RNA polymerase [Medicago truncatula]|uniref:DNA-directed RNA polymerase n=1 Tax=Medicago truncatula TaxID=3880 RepID=G7KWH5_MEDTR|nr:DNA-directed RNA polymerase [Medicago truncatula]